MLCNLTSLSYIIVITVRHVPRHVDYVRLLGILNNIKLKSKTIAESKLAINVKIMEEPFQLETCVVLWGRSSIT